MTKDLHQAIAQVLNAIQKTDSTLKDLKVKSDAIKVKYDPVSLGRNQFNNWRSSDEGKTWKQQQFNTIKGACPKCSVIFPTIDCFQIDHIQPLSDRPDLAIDMNNFQLLCSACNLQKGKSKS
jgi:5-methylcytosine-specific restriction endonuclease McrA